MRFMLVDDDDAIRFMLQDIIEDYDLGEVALSLPDAETIDNDLLAGRNQSKKIISSSCG